MSGTKNLVLLYNILELANTNLNSKYALKEVPLTDIPKDICSYPHRQLKTSCLPLPNKKLIISSCILPKLS